MACEDLAAEDAVFGLDAGDLGRDLGCPVGVLVGEFAYCGEEGRVEDELQGLLGEDEGGEVAEGLAAGWED